MLLQAISAVVAAGLVALEGIDADARDDRVTLITTLRTVTAGRVCSHHAV